MSTQSKTAATSPGWRKITTDSGKLLCRFHPIKNLIEFKVGGSFHYVDLDEYQEADMPLRDGPANNLARMSH